MRPLQGVANINGEFVPAQEAFLCSTAGGIFPIAEVDGRSVGAGSLGPVTDAIRDRYWERHLSGSDVTRVLP